MSSNNNAPPASPKARYFFSAANPEEFRKLFGGSIIHNIGATQKGRGSSITAQQAHTGGPGILARVSDERRRCGNAPPKGALLDSPRCKEGQSKPPTRQLQHNDVSTDTVSEMEFVLSARVADITDKRWVKNQRRMGDSLAAEGGCPPLDEEEGTGGMLGAVANTSIASKGSTNIPPAVAGRKGLHPLDPKFQTWLPSKKKGGSHAAYVATRPGGSYQVHPEDGSLVYHDDADDMAPLPPPDNVSVQNLRDVISDSSDEDGDDHSNDKAIVVGQLLGRREREREREEMADYAAQVLAMGRRGGSASAYLENAKRRLLPVDRHSIRPPHTDATSTTTSGNLRTTIKGCDDMERIDRLIMETMDPTLSDYGDPLDASVPYSGGELPGAQSWATMDRIGFPAPSFPEQVAADRLAQHNLRLASTACDQHWNVALKGVTLLGSATVETCDTLRKLARKYGAPSHLRSLIWMTLSGVSLKMDENDGFFKAIIGKFGLMSGVSQETIEKDLERTFPDHPYFTPGEPGVHRLRLILHALCWRHPLLGYCQSFNFMAAVLLLITDDDEATFFIMCHILENLLPNDYYSDGLMGVKVDQEALVGLLMHALPRVADHFREIRFDIRALVPAWLMSLFVNTFPIETVLRIWDCIITENHTHYTPMPLSILVAFMKVHQEEILQCEDAGELMVFLNRSSTQEYDAQRLIKTAIDLGIKHSELHHIRRKVRETILVDAERRKKARSDMLEQRRLQKESADAAAASSSTPSDQQSVESAMASSTPLGASGVGPSFDESGAVAAFTLREQKEKDERNQRLREISPNYYQNSQKTYQPASSSLEGGRNGTSAVPPPVPQGRRVPAVQEMEEFSRCDGEDSETVSRLTTEANRVAMRTSVVVAKGPASPVAPHHHHTGKPRQAESIDGSSGRESPTNSQPDESVSTPTTATNTVVVGEDTTVPF